MGAARYENGESTEALRLWERALTIADELGDRNSHALLVLNIAEYRMGEGRLEDAYALCLEALQIARDVGVTRVEAYSLILMSQIELKLGNQSKSLEYVAAALDLGQAIDNRLVISQALLQKGCALANALFDASGAAESRHQDAANCFIDAIDLLEGMGEIPNLIRALDAFGVFLREQGKDSEGKQIVMKAQALREQMQTSAKANATPDDTSTIRRRGNTAPVDTEILERKLANKLRRKKVVTGQTQND
jgi:tetratricopeptide (TPR) repeat protein